MKQSESSVPGSLSLQARLGIRDHWDKHETPVKDCFFKLEAVLGHRVVCNPEWPLLLTELDGLFPDARDQVANIAETVLVWAKSMLGLLDPEDLSPWTNKVLEKTESNGAQLKVFLDVNANLTQAATWWSETQGGFVITLPKKQPTQPSELDPVFREQLALCFDEKAPAARAPGAVDDWADIEVDTATGTPQVVVDQASGPSGQGQAGAGEPRPSPYLPTLASIPRPDELLLKPPYHMQLREISRGHMEIQGSHSPSLQLLAKYLERWCRVNHQDTRNPPGITVRLHQASFSLGEMFDRLTLRVHETRYVDRFQPTSPMLLTIIEKVLGYAIVYSQSQGDIWHFRRDTEIIPTGL